MAVPEVPHHDVRGTPSREDVAREGYARHGAELYGFALSRLGDDAAAQDAVQETIVRAWKAGERFDPSRGSLRTWLYAILRNVIIDQAAGRRRASAIAAHQVVGDGMTVDSMEAVHDADLVSRALDTISEEHREAIVETYLRDRSYDDVAAELGISASTLRSRVFHGLRHLRRTLTTMEVQS